MKLVSLSRFAQNIQMNSFQIHFVQIQCYMYLSCFQFFVFLFFLSVTFFRCTYVWICVFDMLGLLNLQEYMLSVHFTSYEVTKCRGSLAVA
jgi:hypothetical protein